MSSANRHESITGRVEIRRLHPSDYEPVISVLDSWWGGRQMVDMLPRLFFDHFANSSFAADRSGRIVGFLVGFVSQCKPGEAYIHFVGVDPEERRNGLGQKLYETFFGEVQARGCRTVRAVTAPVNIGSLAFHRSLGFELERSPTVMDGVPIATNYDGPGRDRVRFVKRLPS